MPLSGTQGARTVTGTFLRMPADMPAPGPSPGDTRLLLSTPTLVR